MKMYPDEHLERIALEPSPTLGPEEYRSPFRRDCGRVLHSFSFRRLQGKTQVFPILESDFFRNRLTHSLEVGQIARSIAIRLNHNEAFLQEPGMALDPDLCELAGWCHDLGHPPFGHNGEETLCELTKCIGGFEGNAQTLRILTRLEVDKAMLEEDASKDTRKDNRTALNLCYRTLASILKYDQELDVGNGVKKGYYPLERRIVRDIKKAICGDSDLEKFKTIECSIMDLADDIAYSTYDLEDAFYAGLLDPLSIRALPLEVFNATVEAVQSSMANAGFERPGNSEVTEAIERVFQLKHSDAIDAHFQSRIIAQMDPARTAFTSFLVGRAIRSVKFEPNQDNPALSKVSLPGDVLLEIEVMKQVAFQTVILAPELRTMRNNGNFILERIFAALIDDEHGRMLPYGFKAALDSCKEQRSKKMRVVADYVAGMTDRYAVEYYARLFSERPMTIFKRV